MAEEYVKTSAEELTAMAEYLRQNGDFEEGQKFIFPSSEYDQSPVYTYKIVDNGAWEEITATEASQLIEQSGYSIEEVSEFPDIQEALANTIYYKIELGIGFKEAYQKYLDDFYDKIMYGTLKQEDLDGVVYSEPVHFFGIYYDIMGVPSFPNITEITVDKEVLKVDEFCRLRYLKKVNIINTSKEVDFIHSSAFYHCSSLEEINIQPIELYSSCFAECSKLKFGEEYLDLTKCINYPYYCLNRTPLVIVPIAADAENVRIGQYAFAYTNLEEIYLPDIPATLANINAFQGIQSNFKFKVTSQAVKNAYLQETNWSSFDESKFEVITS